MPIDVRYYDVVCIGAGGAGVTAATTAAATGCRVLLLSKEPVGYGNTRLSMGVVASCGLVPEDNPDIFLHDLLVGGEYLNNPKLARVMAEEARLVPDLAEGQGQLFQRDSEGGFGRSVLSRAGGHQCYRSLANPGKGIAIGQSLRASAVRAGVDVLEEVLVVKLLRANGRIAGLVAWDLVSGETLVVRSPAIILASGGLGWMYYPHTDCTRTATGDGYALAYEAGAELVDMEQVQFLPFACARPASMVGVLLAEPGHVGPGGRLLDGEGREVLTSMNRMTRAQVARVIGLEMKKGNVTRFGGLRLDLAPNLASPRGHQAWERMQSDGLLDVARRAFGVKAYEWQEPWDVAPSAHFHMGGVRIDEHGATRVPGLFAAGEAAGGVHGANRLGTVALAELFVFGRRAGTAAAIFARQAGPTSMEHGDAAEEESRLAALPGSQGEHRPVVLMRQLQTLLWENVGVVRGEEAMQRALGSLARLRDEARSLRVSSGRERNTEVRDAIELRLMLCGAEMVTRSAIERRESRGAHVRVDYPERDDARWLANVVTRRGEGGMELLVEHLAASGRPA